MAIFIGNDRRNEKKGLTYHERRSIEKNKIQMLPI